jgi:hypothetical protein
MVRIEPKFAVLFYPVERVVPTISSVWDLRVFSRVTWLFSYLGSSMARFIGAIVCILVAGLTLGCQSTVVEHGAHELTATIPSLYYDEVLDNLAKLMDNPQTMPYFGVPSIGAHTNFQQFNAAYSPEFDLNVAHHWLFDKQPIGLTGQVQNQEQLQLQPVINPDKLFLMRYAYWQVMGYPRPHDPIGDTYLKKYYSVTNNYFDYHTYVLDSSWFRTTTNKKEAKKLGCYYSCACGGCVYVPPEELQGFTNFTLAILDIATLETDYFYGNKTLPEIQPGKALAPRMTPLPYSAPPSPSIGQ